MLYGVRNPSQNLTTYQERMNEASKFLALENPSLLLNRSKLMQLARKKVNTDGYIHVYKHGKSRSKQLNLDENLSSSSSSSTGRGTRTSRSERLERMLFLSESIDEINKQMELKEKHREHLSNIHNYGDCEKISKEIADVRQKRGLSCKFNESNNKVIGIRIKGKSAKFEKTQPVMQYLTFPIQIVALYLQMDSHTFCYCTSAANLLFIATYCCTYSFSQL